MRDVLDLRQSPQRRSYHLIRNPSQELYGVGMAYRIHLPFGSGTMRVYLYMTDQPMQVAYRVIL